MLTCLRGTYLFWTKPLCAFVAIFLTFDWKNSSLKFDLLSARRWNHLNNHSSSRMTCHFAIADEVRVASRIAEWNRWAAGVDSERRDARRVRSRVFAVAVALVCLLHAVPASSVCEPWRRAGRIAVAAATRSIDQVVSSTARRRRLLFWRRFRPAERPETDIGTSACTRTPWGEWERQQRRGDNGRAAAAAPPSESRAPLDGHPARAVADRPQSIREPRSRWEVISLLSNTAPLISSPDPNEV